MKTKIWKIRKVTTYIKSDAYILTESIGFFLLLVFFPLATGTAVVLVLVALLLLLFTEAEIP
jgi:hypothetical protein